MSLPAFCQALMAYSSWDCVNSFGDWKSRFTTECQRTSENVRDVVFRVAGAMLEHTIDGRNMSTLNEQYRMSPPISQFPSLQFYSGTLLDHGSVTADSAQRQLMRAFSEQHYAILPGKGCEHM